MAKTLLHPWRQALQHPPSPPVCRQARGRRVFQRYTRLFHAKKKKNSSNLDSVRRWKPSPAPSGAAAPRASQAGMPPESPCALLHVKIQTHCQSSPWRRHSLLFRTGDRRPPRAPPAPARVGAAAVRTAARSQVG